MVQTRKMFAAIVVATAIVTTSGWQGAPVAAQSATATPELAVGPQYDTTHVYVASDDFDRFVASLVTLSAARPLRKVSSL